MIHGGDASVQEECRWSSVDWWLGATVRTIGLECCGRAAAAAHWRRAGEGRSSDGLARERGSELQQ